MISNCKMFRVFLSLLFLLNDVKSGIIKDSFTHLNKTSGIVSSVSEIVVNKQVNKCTKDVLVTFLLNEKIEQGFLSSRDRIIRDISEEIACDPEERTFTRTKGFEIITKGNLINSNDLDDMLIPLGSTVAAFQSTESMQSIQSTKSVPILETVAFSTIQSVLTTRMIELTQPVTTTIIPKTKEEVQAKLDTSVFLIEFVKNFFNDVNDFVFISLIILFELIHLLTNRKNISRFFKNCLERRKIKATQKRQKDIETFIENQRLKHLNQYNLPMVYNEPIRKAPTLSQPIYYNYQSIPVRVSETAPVEFPPPYLQQSNYEIKSFDTQCDCPKTNCNSNRCPCRRANAKCNPRCHPQMKTCKN